MLSDFQEHEIDVGDGITIKVRVKGSGEPIIFLHGYPQTHYLWRFLAPRFAEEYTVVLPDMRGYGESSKPRGTPDHANYSKRAMARDQLRVMTHLGFDRFHLVGHDRGARVAHRLVRDEPERVASACFLDIVPTYEKFMTMDYKAAHASFHWLFLSQPPDLPERLIAAEPEFFLRNLLDRWSGEDYTFPEDAIQTYLRFFQDEATIHATCEDYRAGITVDLEHDEEDKDQPVSRPVMVLWGGGSISGKGYRVMEIWGRWASQVKGYGMDCGHFMPEEAPEETYRYIRTFLQDNAIGR